MGGETSEENLLELEFLVIILALVCGSFGVFLSICLPRSDCVFGHAMSGGVLLASVTTHLLPEVIDGLGGLVTGILVGAMFLGVVMIEDLAKPFFQEDDENHDDHPPKADTPKGGVAVSSVKAICLLIGLSFHSVIEGFGIGTAHTVHKLYFVAATLLTHKILCGFALGQTILATKMKAVEKYVVAVLFVVATPIGGAIGLVVKDAADIHANKVALIAGALEAGAFLQISAVEIIPHIFHLKGNTVSKHTGLVFGFGLMAGLSSVFDHSNDHEDEGTHTDSTHLHHTNTTIHADGHDDEIGELFTLGLVGTIVLLGIVGCVGMVAVWARRPKKKTMKAKLAAQAAKKTPSTRRRLPAKRMG